MVGKAVREDNAVRSSNGCIRTTGSAIRLPGMGYSKVSTDGMMIIHDGGEHIAYLLQLFLNEEDSIHQLSKSLTKIAMVLPTSDILVNLYPNVPQIRQSAQSIYELLIEHFREMLRFYKEKPLKHMFNNVFKPFKVRFEERLKSIKECSKSMSRHANALALRDDRNANAMQIDLLNCILELNRSKHP